MITYFAAVGSDLWGSHKRACRQNRGLQQVLFSYYDLDLGGFQFRRKSWESLTGQPFKRALFDKQKYQKGKAV